MARKREINLVARTDFEFTSLGKLSRWAVNVGRWIVVLTEFVVICAFLSRFYFDTKLANLFDELRQKKAIVNSAISFEDQFRQTQDKIRLVATALSETKQPSLLVNQISGLLPLDTTITEINYNPDGILITGYTLSEKGLKDFLNGLANQNEFAQIALSEVSTQKENTPGTSFKINIELNKTVNQTQKETK